MAAKPSVSLKLVVTSKAALHAKYGVNGFVLIERALQHLIAADKKRGIDTRVIDVPMSSGPRDVKKVFDTLDAKHEPDYFTILGSSDIVTHVALENPAFDGDPEGDTDEFVPSDLPYACDAGYSTQIKEFIAPSRVVTRLPDVTGATDARDLVKLIERAEKYQSRPATAYNAYLGCTAEVWEGSSRKSLNSIFGSSTDLMISPPKGPAWSSAQLKRRLHFFNCHGMPADPTFYGQRGGSYPNAHEAARVDKKLSDGTVAAVECCYGAELYDPAVHGIHEPMCNTYLRSGTYGYWGSTNTAYGSEEEMTCADVICASFLRGVLGGASVGRASLEARQRFVSTQGHLDPLELKTLGQFIALGDSSVHPVRSTADEPKTAAKSTKAAKAITDFVETAVNTREQRRDRLRTVGTRLASQTAVPVRKTARKPSALVQAVISRAAAAFGVPLKSRLDFSVEAKKDASWLAAAKSKGVAPSTYHLALGRDKRAKAEGVVRIVGVVVGESSGKVVSVRDVQSR